MGAGATILAETSRLVKTHLPRFPKLVTGLLDNEQMFWYNGAVKGNRFHPQGWHGRPAGGLPQKGEAAMALSERQQRILAFVRSYIEENSYPPSFREIGRAAGISSTSVVKYNLERLQDLGHIDRTGDISRAIRLTEPTSSLSFTLRVPLLGTIAAGDPIPVPEAVPGAEVDLDNTIELTRDIVQDEQGVYALRVKGDSMIDAFINDGDLVLMRHQLRVENGELAAVWVRSREETTLKRFYLEGSRVRLQPENPDLQPMFFPAQDVEVQGKVIAVIRNLN